MLPFKGTGENADLSETRGYNELQIKNP